MFKLLLVACAISAAAAQCGVPDIPPDTFINIVGGRDAIPGSWPWMVEVIKTNGHWCGGTLINEEWVVSAAHCYERNPVLSNYQFSAGGHVSNDLSETNRQTFSASTIIRHPDYRATTNVNDVALIKLESKAQLDKYVSTACVATSRPSDGDSAYITGWGNQEKIIFDKDLQQANVPIVSQATCNGAYPGSIKDSMICAGYLAGGIDTCQGDSGGPMVVKDINNGLWNLVGITSWGIGCADAGYYGVYADVAHLSSWIKETIAAN